jgi:hypothetical protein
MSKGRAVLVSSALAGLCAIVAAGCGDSSDSGRGKIDGTPGQTGAGGAGAPAGAAPTGSTLSAVMYGDEGQQTFGGSVVDATGNVYVVGRENQNRPQISTPTGRAFGDLQGASNGLFVVKYSPTGVLLWRQPYPTTGDTIARLAGVALQPTTGAVIVAGSLMGSLPLEDGTTLTSGIHAELQIPTDNLFLIALDTAGYLVWSRLYSSSMPVDPQRVFVTASGDIEVVGGASDNATVGGAPLCCRTGQTGQDTFMARYSPTGDPIWSTAITGGNLVFIDAAADADGGLAVAGALDGAMTFDSQTFNAGVDVFAGTVVRTDPQGHLRWAHVYAGPEHASGQLGAGLDASGNVLLYGLFQGSLDLGSGHVLQQPGGGAPVGPPGQVGVLAKLSPDGDTLWANQLPAEGYDTFMGAAIAADAAGNIALAGMAAGGLSLGGAPVLPAGAAGDFVAKFDPNGRPLWDRGFAVQKSNDAFRRFGVGFDGAGRIGVAAEFDNTVDFGIGPLTPSGQPTSGTSAPPMVPDDVYVLKLAP